jgi:hypothetical protein
VVRDTKNRRSVFLSYSDRDREAVRRIVRDVTDALPGRYRFWDHSQDIVPGSNFAADVAKALDQSSAMLVFVSPNYLSSEWGRRELEFALSSEQYEGRVIAVLIRDTEKAPWILERLVYIDATERPAGAGKEIAKALESSEGAGE